MNIDWHYERGAGASAGPVDFYQRGEFHDLELARFHLGRALGDRMTVASCDVFNVRYLPGKSLQVLYTLSGADASHATVTARFLPSGRSATHYAEACAGAADARRVLHIPGWDCVARVFPEDPGLPALAGMLDAGGVTARLGRATAVSLEPASCQATLLSYLPGDRCALRYRWQPDGPAFVGKLQDSAEASHRAMQSLWRLPGRRFGMAEPIDCDARSGIRWERFVPGRRIDQLIPQLGLDEALKEVVSGLVQLHRTSASGLRLQRPREILARLQRKVLPRIRHSLGAVSDACDTFSERLARQADGLPERALSTVHGDLHTANILVGPEGPNLIDLDSLALGDPAFDLALLGSRLLLIGLVEQRGDRGLGQAVERLPDIYAEVGGSPIPPETFAWYMGAMLVGRQIKTCILHLAPSLDALSRALLHIGQATLEGRRFEAELLAQV